MNPIRTAILVAFVGASLWVYFTWQGQRQALLLQTAGMRGTTIAHEAANPSNGPYLDQYNPAALQREAVVVTVAGVAWVLAAMVKLKV